jgi:hypothetical protein
MSADAARAARVAVREGKMVGVARIELATPCDVTS